MLDLEISARVARLWLAKPQVRNALDDQLILTLTETLHDLSAREDVQVVVLAGRGDAFCAGGDLRWMRRMAEFSRDENVADAARLAALFATLDAMPQTTIARVHGACFAGALGLVSACDLAFASDDSRYCLSEVKLGLVPATISPYVVRAIGFRTATRYMLTAETFDAAAARAMGLIHDMAPIDELDSLIGRTVEELLKGGRLAQRSSKELLRHLQGRRIDGDLAAHTAEFIATARATSEARERIGDFLERSRK